MLQYVGLKEHVLRLQAMTWNRIALDSTYYVALKDPIDGNQPQENDIKNSVKLSPENPYLLGLPSQERFILILKSVTKNHPIFIVYCNH